jgi:uncharacterized Zn finger protein
VRWTLETIAALSDPGTLQRGRAYATSGRVTDIRRSADGVVTARVTGKSTYRVRLTDRGGTCDCPIGSDGGFCKHCVAVALAVAEQPDLGPITDWLKTLDRSVLIELVEEAAAMSEAFARQLELRVKAPRESEDVDEAADVSSLLKDDPEAAWEVAAANPEGVEDDIWLQLAACRAGDFPAAVVPIYRMLIDKLLLTANRNNYSDAVRLLKRMERAAEAAGEPHPEEFAEYVCELHERYERRPSFITILDRAYPAAAEST